MPVIEYETLITVPPDGGYGWIIVIIAYFGFVCIDVPSFGFSTISIYLADELDQQMHIIATICSTYVLFMYVTGPIAAGVCNRYGFRITLTVGAILGVLAKIGSYYVYDYYSFLVVHGVIGGIGGSFIFMMSSVAPGFWFEQKRAIVMGITSSATGVGCLSTMASEEVVTKWGWRSAFLFWLAVYILLLLSSFFVKAPPTIEVEVDTRGSKRGEIDHSNVAVNRLGPRRYSLVDRKMRQMSNAGIPIQRTLGLPSRYVFEEDYKWKAKVHRFFCRCCSQYDAVGSRPLYRSDIFYNGSLAYIAQKKNVPLAAMTLSVSRLPTVRDVKQEVECHCGIPESVKQPIMEMLDIKLFKSPTFLFLVSSAFFHYVSLYVPILMLNKLNMKFLDKEYALLTVPILGAGCTASRLLVGFVLILLPGVEATTMVVIGTFLGGVVTCLFEVCENMYYQYIMAFCCGFFVGVFVPLRTVVIIDILGLDKLTSVIGTLFFFQGIGSFIGLPLAEWLIEYTDHEYAGMYMSGLTMLLNSFFLCIIAVIYHFKSKKK